MVIVTSSSPPMTPDDGVTSIHEGAPTISNTLDSNPLLMMEVVKVLVSEVNTSAIMLSADHFRGLRSIFILNTPPQLELFPASSFSWLWGSEKVTT